MDLVSRVARAIDRLVVRTHPLSGGCVARVARVELADGSSVVVKHGGDSFLIDAEMLRALAERSALPVPAVLSAEPDLLILEHVEHDGRAGDSAERHAADLLASLHGVAGEAFGFETETLIGSLAQPSSPCDSWVRFFAERRLMHFGGLARERGAISAACWDRLRRLADRLPTVIDEPDHPSLIHGDVWGGNVLMHAGRVAAFIDPATHYAHPEVELAFITLFATFGRTFFGRYAARRPLREGFFERRRHVYNAYPLLVHAILFGGAYGAQLERTLDAAGF